MAQVMLRGVRRQSAIKNYGLLLSVSLLSAHALALQPLSETEMAETTGQSLLNVLETPAATSGVNNGIGFTRVGLQATVDINANINKLQLGCGGANHPTGGCDIDIDNLSLSGRDNGTTARPATDAKMTNPFLEFAIKDPKKASTRQIVGMRFGADKMDGMMTFGKENSATPNGINSFSGYMVAQSDSSGTIYGKANTKPLFIDFADKTMVAVGPNSPLYNPAATTQVKQAINENTGMMDVYFFGGKLGDLKFTTNGGGYWLPTMTNLPFTTGKATINGNSEKNTDHANNTLSISASMNVPTAYLGRNPVDPNCGSNNHACSNGNTIPIASQNYPALGVYDPANNQARTLGAGQWDSAGNLMLDGNGKPLGAKALVTNCSLALLIQCGLAPQLNNVHFYMKVADLNANAKISQNLGFLHKIDINSPFSLSLQKQDVHWTDSAADDIAKPGWWMSTKDPVNLGSMSPVELVDMCPDKADPSCVLPQIRDQVNKYLSIPANRPATADLGGALLGGVVATELGTASLSTPLNVQLTNIQLASQFFNVNCYGTGRTFC